MQPHHLHELLETTFRGSTVLFRPWRSFHTSTCIKQWCLYCRKHWTSLGHLKTSWKFVNKRVNCDISSEHRWKDLCCQCGWPKKKFFFSIASLWHPYVTLHLAACHVFFCWLEQYTISLLSIEVLPCDVPIKKNVCVIFWKYDKVN